HCIHHFDCEKWKTGCGDCPYPDKPFAINFDDTALQFELKKQAVQNSQIAAIVASGWMEDKIKQSPIWSGKKIYKIPFGINQNIFKPADIKEAKKKMEIDPVDRVLFFRSDESPYKGLNILKQTLSSLPRNEKISILTVGEKGLLYEFAEKYKIKEFGWISDDKKLAELYQACDLFLMPSEQETFGMMAVEAMSCGKTVVALDGNTALPNTINAPECGTAVSVKDFPTEIQRLLNNREEMIGRGEKSLQYAKQNYNKDIYVKRIIDTYKDVMSDHKSDDAAKHILQQSARKSENISRKKFPLWYRYLARPLLRLVLKKYKVKFEYDSRFTKK
ncbi:MAG: glycosyltransferase, partial [Holosporaceae bacterium]|nr:glycosyltransferase [Holosporaceae bacterium]